MNRNDDNRLGKQKFSSIGCSVDIVVIYVHCAHTGDFRINSNLKISHSLYSAVINCTHPVVVLIVQVYLHVFAQFFHTCLVLLN